jgi:hypothetical protein
MRKVIFSSALILSVYSFALANADVKPGYIVTLENDTIEGFIKSYNEFENNRAIGFSRTSDGQFTDYRPIDIRAYYMNDNRNYVAMDVEYQWIEQNPAEMDEGVSTNAVTPFQQKLFLQVLVDGQASLYTFLDDQSDSHFYIRKDAGPLTELRTEYVHREVPQGASTKSGYVEQKKYLGILNYFFSDCEDLAQKIPGTELSTAGLSAITIEYNRCKDPFSAPKIYESTPKLLVRKSFLLGMTMANYDFEGGDAIYNYLTVPAPAANTNITMGFNFELKFPRKKNIFSLVTGLSYYRNNYTTEYSKPVPPASEWHYKTTLDYHYLKIPIFVKATINTGKLKPYVIGGIYGNFVIKGQNELTLMKMYPDDETETVESPALVLLTGEDATRNVELFGFSGGIGLDLSLGDRNGIFIESRYDRGPSPSTIGGMSSNQTVIFFTGGYYF